MDTHPPAMINESYSGFEDFGKITYLQKCAFWEPKTLFIISTLSIAEQIALADSEIVM